MDGVRSWVALEEIPMKSWGEVRRRWLGAMAAAVRMRGQIGKPLN